MKPNRTKEDILLLSQLQQGDKKAFNTLFRRYYPILCAYAHRFVDFGRCGRNSSGCNVVVMGESRNLIDRIIP